MQNFMINAIKATIVAFIAITTFLMGNCYGYKKALPLLNAYDNYNKQCEILLDSIATWDNSFMDTTGETDTYYDYLDSREMLDSLLYN